MVWVCATLTFVLAVQTLFVVGVLGSHADLVQRLTTLENLSSDRTPEATLSMPDGVVAMPPTTEQREVNTLRGTDVDLRPTEVDLSSIATRYTLLAFVSTSCLSCLEIWRDVIEAGPDAAMIEADEDAATLFIVLKGREVENLGKARLLAKETLPSVLFSSQAWEEMDVPGSPYFALIDNRSQLVVGAGSASTWTQLRTLASDAMLELSLAAQIDAGIASATGYRSLIAREDGELRQAGLLPGDPSLTAAISGEQELD